VLAGSGIEIGLLLKDGIAEVIDAELDLLACFSKRLFMKSRVSLKIQQKVQT